MSKERKPEELKTRIKLLEKEIFKLKGRERVEARTEYLRLLKFGGKEFGLEEPIYIMRC